MREYQIDELGRKEPNELSSSVSDIHRQLLNAVLEDAAKLCENAEFREDSNPGHECARLIRGLKK